MKITPIQMMHENCNKGKNSYRPTLLRSVKWVCQISTKHISTPDTHTFSVDSLNISPEPTLLANDW